MTATTIARPLALAAALLALCAPAATAATPADLTDQAVSYWQRTTGLKPPCAPVWTPDPAVAPFVATTRWLSCEGRYDPARQLSDRDLCHAIVHEVGHMVGFVHDEHGRTHLPNAPPVMDYATVYTTPIFECGDQGDPTLAPATPRLRKCERRRWAIRARWVRACGKGQVTRPARHQQQTR